ncbi:MAG: rhodanese-like domain-containing protein [Gammaproteobacteria bacterium]|nr:rhodanese-like domain-containing protein [Gammaproteobacteria bacterium]
MFGRLLKTLLGLLWVGGSFTLPAAGLVSPAIAPVLLARQLDSHTPPRIVDVRSPEEYSAGHIPGAVNIPAPVIRDRVDELKQSAELVLYCNDGLYTKVVELFLINQGVAHFSHLAGGFKAWDRALLPVMIETH